MIIKNSLKEYVYIQLIEITIRRKLRNKLTLKTHTKKGHKRQTQRTSKPSQGQGQRKRMNSQVRHNAP